MTTYVTAPTAKQISYVRLLQKKLYLPDTLLDVHCETQFGVVFAGCDRSTVSALIDDMLGWTTLPADLQRANGQLDLIGLGEG